MATVAEYIALITSEHQDKPNYIETVSVGLRPISRVQDVLASMPFEFDIDSAVGVQLDAVGEWVGRSRYIDTPLTGIYFTWRGTVTTGWRSGSWKGRFDPDTGLTRLPDDAYRTLLKATIAANSWDGSIPGAYAVWVSVFDNGSIILIQDNQDMSMVVGIAGARLGAIEQALLTNGIIRLKPEGVRVRYYAVTPEGGKLFAWRAQSDALAGWREGQWATRL